MQTPQIAIPSIFTANTYFYSPASTASGRRRNEERRISEATNFFKSLGFEVIEKSNSIDAILGEIEVSFSYSESCQNVYKSLSVYKKGKKSNITTLKKLLS